MENKDKSGVYERQLNKLVKTLVVDVYPVVHDVEVRVTKNNDNSLDDDYDYTVNFYVIYSGNILDEIPRYKRLPKIKKELDLNQDTALWDFFKKYVKYVIPESFEFLMFNDIDLLPIKSEK